MMSVDDTKVGQTKCFIGLQDPIGRLRERENAERVIYIIDFIVFIMFE